MSTPDPAAPDQPSDALGATRPLAGAALPAARAPAVPLAVAPVPQPMAPRPHPDVHPVTRLEWTSGKPLSGRYVMVQKLGEGGMGTVYLAEDLLLRRRVAVKTLWDEDAYDPLDIERFRKEVALAHSVNHRNVSRTYDLSEAGGVHFITMEYLKGETLMARIRRGPALTSKEVRDMAVPLCRGLLAAHRAGVVHRDLKPANIMLVPDDRKVVIMDFGIARSVTDVLDEMTASRRHAQSAASTPWDVTSAGLGTPAYMAPEQWDEASGDQRTDIYALGVILYVCLTGQAPYAADTPDALGEQHRKAPVPDVSALAKGVDGELARLIRDCLAKRAEDRPQSMAHVLERLERPERRRRYALQLAGSVAATAAVLFLLGFAFFSVARRSILKEMRPSLARLAELVARDISADDLDQVKTPADIGHPGFARVQATMARYHAENPEIRYFYTMRPGEAPGLYHYVVDEQPKDVDRDQDGAISEDEKGTPPGQFYDGRHLPAMAAVLATGKPQTDQGFAQDGFEVTLSGYAPVLRAGKAAGYFVGVDVTNEQLKKLKMRLFLLFGGATLAVAVLLAWLLAPRRQQQRALAAFDKARHPDAG